MRVLWIGVLAGLMAITGCASTSIDDALLTEAERSGYARTMTYEQVVGVLEEIDARSEIVHLTSMGTTVEGRSIPLVVIAN
ncbi:MAG: hypothetical protein ACF8GE_05625, partial [Phycisphaerales bacterium JB043]